MLLVSYRTGNIRELFRDAQPFRGLRIRRHDAVRLEAEEAGPPQARRSREGPPLLPGRALQRLHQGV